MNKHAAVNFHLKCAAAEGLKLQAPRKWAAERGGGDRDITWGAGLVLGQLAG